MSVHLHATGSNPEWHVDAQKLVLALGVAEPSSSTRDVEFHIQHGSGPPQQPLFALSAGGGRPDGPDAHVALRTWSPDCNAHVTRLRLGPNGATAEGDFAVKGAVHAAVYANLVDDLSSTNGLVPPTAFALSRAFASLCNLIITRTPPPDGRSNLDPSISSLPMDTTLAAGRVVCTGLNVVPGGSIVAGSYCNLVDDFRLSKFGVPASAHALNTAYTQLSNAIEARVATLRLLGVHAAGNAPLPSALALGPLPVDMWLGTGDGRDVLRFRRADVGGTTEFMGGAASQGLAPCFTFGAVGAPDGTAPLMSLSANAELFVAGAVRAQAGYCNLPDATDDAAGIVRLASSSAPAPSNSAASAAVVSALHDVAMAANDTTRALYEATVYTAGDAHDRATAASNAAHAQRFVRAYSQASEHVAGVELFNADASGGVRLALRAGLSVEANVKLDATSNVLTVQNTSAGAVELVSSTPGSGAAPCTLRVAEDVTISGGVSALQSFPPDLRSDQGDPSGYTASASSVFSAATWAQAHQGVSALPEDTGWASAPGTYDAATGAPSQAADSTSAAALTRQGGGDVIVRGEWLQFTAPEPIFPRAYSLLCRNPNHAASSWVLLGSGDAGYTWRVLAAAQDNVLPDGSVLALDARPSTGFNMFRIVLTRVAGGSPAYPTLVQVDTLKVIGGVGAPTSDLLFRVDASTLCVARDGKVGILTPEPLAPLDIAPPAGGVSRKRTVVLGGDGSSEHEFCGLGFLAGGSLTYQAAAPQACHVFEAASGAASSLEIMRLCGDGRVGIGCAEPTCGLDVRAGAVNTVAGFWLQGRALVGSNWDVDMRAPHALAGRGGLTVHGSTGRVAVGLVGGAEGARAPLDVQSLPAMFGPSNGRGACVLSLDSDLAHFASGDHVFSGPATFVEPVTFSNVLSITARDGSPATLRLGTAELRTLDAGDAIALATDGQARLVVRKDGQVALGASASAVMPLAPLHVASQRTLEFQNGVQHPVSIWAVGGVATQGSFLTSSDARLKDVTARGSSLADLELLDRIDVVRYRRRDGGSKAPERLGFLAQQVRETLPDAVALHEGCVPDVMAAVLGVRDAAAWDAREAWLELPSSAPPLVPGEHVRLQERRKELTWDVQVLSSNAGVAGTHLVLVRARTGADLRQLMACGGELFVYGRTVQDMHTLEYNSVFALAVAGVQQLNQVRKDAEARIAALEHAVSQCSCGVMSAETGRHQ